MIYALCVLGGMVLLPSIQVLADFFHGSKEQHVELSAARRASFTSTDKKGAS